MRSFAACFVLLVFSTFSFAQVTVTGEGVVNSNPDLASFRVTVTTQAENMKKSLEDNNATMSKVRSIACESFEVSMTTTGFNIWSSKKDKSEVVVYYVSNSLSLSCKVGDLSKLLEAVTVDDNCSINSLMFGFTDAKKNLLLDKSRRVAVEDAIKKAKSYTDAAGVRLGKVLSIEEKYVHSPVVQRGDYSRFRSEVPVSPGTSSVRVQVLVRFSLD